MYLMDYVDMRKFELILSSLFPIPLVELYIILYVLNRV